MGGDKRFGGIRRGKSHGLIFAFACLTLLAGGCSKSEPEKADNGATFDSSRLPRVSGPKEIFASPATTIFTSPNSVAQTADVLDKALAAAGWQKYVAPNTVYSQDPKMRAMSLKRGTHPLFNVRHVRSQSLHNKIPKMFRVIGWQMAFLLPNQHKQTHPRVPFWL